MFGNVLPRLHLSFIIQSMQYTWLDFSWELLIVLYTIAGFRLALVQLSVCANKQENLARAARLVKEATAGGAQMVALPECFNSPYGTRK